MFGKDSSLSIGDQVETVGRMLRNGIVREILQSGHTGVAVVEWPNGIVDSRLFRTLRKIS